MTEPPTTAPTSPPGPDTMTVRGGVPVEGELHIRGSKNALPKAMVAALLTSESCRLTNISTIRDIEVVSELIGLTGALRHVTSPR